MWSKSSNNYVSSNLFVDKIQPHQCLVSHTKIFTLWSTKTSLATIQTSLATILTSLATILTSLATILTSLAIIQTSLATIQTSLATIQTLIRCLDSTKKLLKVTHYIIKDYLPEIFHLLLDPVSNCNYIHILSNTNKHKLLQNVRKFTKVSSNFQQFNYILLLSAVWNFNTFNISNQVNSFNAWSLKSE